MNKDRFTQWGKTLFATSMCSLLLASCTDNFENMNRNPTEPTDPEISEGNYKLGAFFPQMINYAYPAQENAYQMGENLIGDPYGRYLSIANSGFSSNFSIFNAPAGWIDSPFKDAYEKVYGSWTQIKAITDKDENLKQIFAWAQIVRITAMQRMTDMYGPIPYSKVGNGDITTKYDSQEKVYHEMFNDLDNAIHILSDFVKANPNYRNMERFDKVYGSDFSKWIKYANSLKLRMAMRIVYADPAFAKQKAEEAVNDPGGLITGNSDMTQNAYPQNPIWTMTSGWGDSQVCADIVAYMNGYKDPRIGKYFTPSQLVKTEKDKVVYLGLRTGVALPGKDKTALYSSSTYTKTAPTLWMNASEISFLRAEGALRGWNMGGSAQNFYEEGIRLSFAQWMADGSDTYINDDSSKPAGIDDPNPKYAAEPISSITIKWNDADSFETKLERLITQKWIAMYPLGLEAWSEQRRTGYPHFYPVLVNAGDDENLTTHLASRIPFSPDEKINNQTNYQEAVKLLGGADNYSTKLWWDKNPNKGW